jgi:hypothetical protein
VKSLQFFPVIAITRACTNGATPRLNVSENSHFLATAEDRPFFYLGVTKRFLAPGKNRSPQKAFECLPSRHHRITFNT